MNMRCCKPVLWAAMVRRINWRRSRWRRHWRPSPKRSGSITAILPGLWHPGVVAKMIATLDQISNGRAAVNIVSGWFKDEFHKYGQPWLDHDERYRRSEEFIRVLRSMWTQEETTFTGAFYRIWQAPLKPRPATLPPVFQGGNSKAAKQMAARVSDWYFMNGNTLEGIRKQIDEVKELAALEGRKVQFGVNGFVIVRDTEEEAKQVLREIVAHADPKVVEGFRDQLRFAGKASPEREGMWANSGFEDLVQYNDGFKTGLIGNARAGGRPDHCVEKSRGEPDLDRIFAL